MTPSQPEMGSPCPTHNTNRPQSVEENITPLSKGTHDSIKLVLLGQTGTGKSACGNTILGKKKFKSRASAVPVTKECQVEEFDIFDEHVTVIDTPDFFDEEMQTQSQLHAEKYRELCQSGGSCVYLLVMEVGRFTDGERDILDKLEKALVLKKDKTIILFTRGDRLKCDQMTIQDFVNGMDPVLKNTVRQCGERFHVFENSKSDEKQVKYLMKMVHTLLRHSQGLEDSKSQGGSTGCGIAGCVLE